MGTATRPDCSDLHVVTAPPEKVLDLQSRDPRSCTSSMSGNKRCPITPPPTLDAKHHGASLSERWNVTWVGNNSVCTH